METQRLWNVFMKMMPVIMGATGTILNSFRKYPIDMLGKHDIRELQKTSHIGHCTHTAGSANVKLRNIQRGK